MSLLIGMDLKISYQLGTLKLSIDFIQIFRNNENNNRTVNLKKSVTNHADSNRLLSVRCRGRGHHPCANKCRPCTGCERDNLVENLRLPLQCKPIHVLAVQVTTNKMCAPPQAHTHVDYPSEQQFTAGMSGTRSPSVPRLRYAPSGERFFYLFFSY